MRMIERKIVERSRRDISEFKKKIEILNDKSSV